MTARNSRLSIISIGLTVVALAMVLAARTGWAVTPCEDIDPQCMRNGVCQADGTCAGEVINEGQPCNTGDPCALTPQSAQCQSGHCVTTTNKPEGTACTFPGAGLCIKNTTCQSLFGFGPFCMTQNENDIVDCDALGHKCMACDPNTGQCTIPLVPGPCETGECNPATGLFQDAPNGTACNDFNVCTSDEQCQGGVCRSGTAPTPTPTVPIGPATCTGDCNNLHVVTVDNLLTMIDIGLGKTSIAACMAGDRDHNFHITVDEVITAVPNALDGCPAVPTPTQTPTSPPQAATATPTITPTPGGPTPTRTATAGAQTSPGPGSAVSGQTVIALSSVTVIGDVVAAVVNGITIGAASSAGSSAELLMTPADPGLGSAAGACPLGGSATRTGNPLTGYTVTFESGCAVPTADGGKVAFGGMASLGLFSGITAGVTATFSNLDGTTVFEEASASVTGSVSNFHQSVSCYIDAITFTLFGSLSTTMMPPDGPNVGVLFANTTLAVSNITFSPECVPTAYDLTLNGPATLLAPDGTQEDVTFSNLTLHIASGATATTMTVNGSMNSPCFGGTSTIATSTPLTVPVHEGCPNAGLITATLPQGGSATITFGPGESVHIQSPTEHLDADNCYDPRLLACLA